MRTSLWYVLVLMLAAVPVTLTGCGKSPPTGDVKAAIEKEIRSSRPDLIDTSVEGVDVTSITLADFKQIKSATRANAGLPVFEGDWTAKVRFKEPYGWVVVMIDGTRVVRTVANKGDEVECKGTVHAYLDEDDEKWHATAMMQGEPWSTLWDKIADSKGMAPTFAYRVVSSDGGSSTAPRGTDFLPHSKLKPMVVEDSPEMKKLLADSAEKQRIAQEAAEAERQRRQAEAVERQRKAMEEAAERQRIAQAEAAERQRVAQEQAAERRRVAEEEAKQQAEAQRRARLTPLIQPFQGESGAVIVSDAGTTMGTVILNAQVDEEKFTVKGDGIDLREMPFREFTFEATIDPRNVLVMKSSIGAAPLEFSRATASGITGNGVSLSSLDAAERQRLDALIATGKKLGSATPAGLNVEVLDANAAKARPADLTLTGIPGTIFYRGRNDARIAGLFAGTVSRSAYTWRQELVCIRLPEPGTCAGLYIRGSGAATDNLLVVVNGVHRARIEAMPANGAAIISLPPGTEVLDLRFEALGSAQSRGIAMIK
ncbi:MAG: hypothetical protein KF745_00040 [Phycisphaeraceae bacterium]|nr:hypothetical protein [Phycisphaeraceae bacterium]